MALSTSRAPDLLVDGVPMPALPKAPHLQIRRSRIGTIGTWACVVLAVMAVVASPQALPMAGVFLVCVLGLSNMSMQRPFAEAFNVETAKLLAGDVDGAAAGFDDIARRYRQPMARALTLFNLGLVELRRGNLEDALSLFGAVYASKRLKAQPLIGAQLPALMASVYARLGDVAGARAWLDKAKDRPPLGEPARAYAEALLLVREGRHDDAEAAYERTWPLFLNGQAQQLAEARIFRAFAAASRGAPTTTLLAPLRPHTPGTWQHLAAGWPELQAFLADEQLL
jgi:tetratricopeptide (TPR) repeat protein